MKRFLLPGLLSLCALPAAAQTMVDDLTGLFLLRRQLPELYATVAASGYRAVPSPTGYKTFTRGTDTIEVHIAKEQAASIRFSSRDRKNYLWATRGWTVLGWDGNSFGKLADAGPEGIYWIFGLRYRQRVVYTILESADYSKKIEDGVIE